MKFGKTFLTHQIPEWAVSYMNYKHLKKIIKNIDQQLEYIDTVKVDVPSFVTTVLSEFFFELDRDIDKVNEYYNRQYKEYSRRLDKVVAVVGYKDGHISHQIESSDELDEVISILMELRTIYRNLKWFGELNHKGFVKILKKLDKKLEKLAHASNLELGNNSIKLPVNNKENYLATRVDALPFANQEGLLAGLDLINKLLNDLGAQHMATTGLASHRQPLPWSPAVEQVFLQEYNLAIDNDDPEALLDRLLEAPQQRKNLKYVLSLLNRATLANALKCIDFLLEYLLELTHSRNINVRNALFDKFDISGRNFFHQHVVSLGKRQVIHEHKQVTPGESTDVNRLYGNDGGPDGSQLRPVETTGLSHILQYIDSQDILRPPLGEMLVAKDNYARTPLHYAAQYGLKDVSRVLLEYLYKWKLINSSVPIDNHDTWADQEGLTPLHLSIIGKHPKTTDTLIIYSHSHLSCPSLLLLAVRLNSPDILVDLIRKGKIDVNYTDLEHNNETALYIAAKHNYVEVVEFLLSERANTEIGENVFGWTPVFVAASEGFKEVVRLLVDAECKIDIVDDSGWLPMEHACLRGHLEVADMLKPKNEALLLYDMDNQNNNLQRIPNLALNSPVPTESTDEVGLSTTSVDRLPESNKSAVNEVYRQLRQLEGPHGRNSSRSKSPMSRRKAKPVKSFGHKYLAPSEQLVLITLGTTDLRDDRAPVDLNKISMSKSLFTELDTALSLVVTCRNGRNGTGVEAPVVVDLPLEDHHGSSTDPITFQLPVLTPIDNIVVTFDIVPTYQYSNAPIDVNHPLRRDQKILGRAVALLGSMYTGVGPLLRSLNSTITSPIVESDSLDILGSVRFEYMLITPFEHPAMKLSRSDTYWKQLVSTRVIGHRGLGKNMSNKKSLQLGENTVESFIAAASLGASYVEFDVQLTKDFVPVIYHDFTVAESGVDIPMNALTAEQFLNLHEEDERIAKEKNKKSIKEKISNGDKKVSFKSNYSLDDEMLGKLNRPRSMSSYPSAPDFKPVNHTHVDEDDELDLEVKEHFNRRMKLTKTWKDKGFKGNARGLSIASNFVTLKDLFKKLPSNVGFNIEIKYPMLDEAENESMGEVAIDLNKYVDTILKTVYDENRTGRDIIFSSFHPDVCVLLSLKQPTIPILFLTEGGTQFMADIRASSLQNAIRFAKKWNLLGIVSAAKTLVKTPRLAQVVKSSGLVCVTYGVENNSPELAKIQMKAGVDAVIADSVLAVRESLRGGQADGQADGSPDASSNEGMREKE